MIETFSAFVAISAGGIILVFGVAFILDLFYLRKVNKNKKERDAEEIIARLKGYSTYRTSYPEPR